jgi:hypothetical protein
VPKAAKLVPMLVLGLMVVSEQVLVLRLNTAVPCGVVDRGTSPPRGDPSFIGRAEASTRSLPRPSSVHVSCPARQPLAVFRGNGELAPGSRPTRSCARRGDLNRRI